MAIHHTEPRLKKIRDLMGWVGDGSNTTVTLSQDDATNDFILKVGDSTFSDTSFERVIDRAARFLLASDADK